MSPSENRVLPASNLKLEEREFVVDSGASMHMISKKDLSEAEMDTLTKSCSPTMVITANGEAQTHEEAIVYVKELDIFLTMKVLENTPAVLSLGKFCDENGYSYEWINGQKPHLIKNGIRIICNTENFVPIVVPGLSSSSSTSSSSLRTPIKQESHSSSSSSSSSPSSPTVGDLSVREREDVTNSDISPVPVSKLAGDRSGKPEQTQANIIQKTNKKETTITRGDPLCSDNSEISEWLQEFRENLVDDEIPIQGGSHASSSHEKCSFAHRQVDSQPTKRSESNNDKSAVAMLKKENWQEREFVSDSCHDRTGKPVRKSGKKLGQNSSRSQFSDARQLGCVFQDMTPPKSILRKSNDMPRPIQRVKFTKAIAHHTKIRDQNPSLGYICPGEPHERSPNAPKFEDRSQEETEWQEQGAREAAWKLGKSVFKFKEHEKAAFFSSPEKRCLLASTLKPEEREFVVDSGASMHMISKKDLSKAEMDTLTKSCSPTIVITANGEVQTHEEATVYVKQFDIFFSESPRKHASSLIAWKALR